MVALSANLPVHHPKSHHPPCLGLSLESQIFFLLKTALKDSPQGPPIANHQPPSTATNRQLPTANRQPSKYRRSHDQEAESVPVSIRFYWRRSCFFFLPLKDSAGPAPQSRCYCRWIEARGCLFPSLLAASTQDQQMAMGGACRAQFLTLIVCPHAACACGMAAVHCAQELREKDGVNDVTHSTMLNVYGQMGNPLPPHAPRGLDIRILAALSARPSHADGKLLCHIRRD